MKRQKMSLEGMDVDPEEPVVPESDNTLTMGSQSQQLKDEIPNGPFGSNDYVEFGVSTCGKLDSQLTFCDTMMIHWTPKLPSSIQLFNPKKNPPVWVNSEVITHGHPTLGSPTKWRVQCTKDGFHDNRRYVAIYLWRMFSNYKDFNRRFDGVDEIECLYKIDILDRDGQPVFTRESGCRIFQRNERYGWKDFALYDKVEPFLNDGKIHLRITLKTVVYTPNLDISESDKIVTVKMEDFMICRIKKSILLGKCKDLREAVLQKLDSSDLEISKDVLNVHGMGTLKNLFQYLELGSCPLITAKDVARLPEFWDFACKLDLQGLKVDIFDALTHPDSIRVGNVTALVIFVVKNAETIRQPLSPFAKFYNRIKRFVFENMEQISESESFKKAFEQDTKVAEEFANLVMEDDLSEPVLE